MKSQLRELVEQAVEGAGFEIVRYHNHPRTLLRLWVDHQDQPLEGDGRRITMQDCISLNRVVLDALDADGQDAGLFQVEVLSPGLDRLLVRARDFQRFAGRKVKLRLKRRGGERRNYSGTLVGLQNGVITLQGEDEWTFARRDVDEVRLVPQLPFAFDKRNGHKKKGKRPSGRQAKAQERTRKPRKARRKRPKDH